MSQADRDLVERLRNEGVPITDRKLKRWRDLGYGPRSERRWLGRKGSMSVYPPESVDYLRSLASEARPRRRLHEIVLTLFGRGGSVPEGALRVAYKNFFADFETFVATRGGPEASERADAIAPLIESAALRTRRGRLHRSRLSGRGHSRDAAYLRAMTGLVQLILPGPPVAAADLTDLLQSQGLNAFATDRHGELGPIAPSTAAIADSVRQSAKALSMEALRAACATASLFDFERARDEWKEILSFSAVATTVLSAQTGLPDAFGFGMVRGMVIDDPSTLYTGVPAMLVYRATQGSELDQFLATARQEGPRYRAMAALLPDIPEQFRQYLAPDGMAKLAQLSDTERNSVMEVIRLALARHPVEATLVIASATA